MTPRLPLIRLLLSCSVALATLAAGTIGALAQDFFKGKSIKVVIRSTAGDGGNDFYGRLMARHMPRHIPGNPGTIPINMAGASGVVAANYIYSRAKRDGTEIGILARAIAVAQRTKTKGVQYDVRELIPLGSVANDTAVFFVTKASKLNSLKDLKRDGPEVLFAATGTSGGPYQRAMLLKLDGYPIKIITGYASNAEKVLAMMRGEVEMSAGSIETVIGSVREEKFRIVGMLGAPHPDMPPNVPDLREVLGPDQRALATLLLAPLEAGRPFYAPPNVPPDRVTMLRAAFAKAISDPQLLDEARRAQKNITPTDPERMAKTNLEVLAAPDAVVENFKKIGTD